MAISSKIFNKFEEYTCKSSSILELGNQTFTQDCILENKDKLKKFNNATPVKKYVEQMGIKHTSIDITGLDGSIPIDLNMESIPISDKFDLVTNFGTTEHIEPNQYEPFYHIHNLCSVYGTMIHEVPVVGHWVGHCKYYYDESFFEFISEKNNYKIIEMYRVNYGSVGDLIFVSMIKNSDNPFITDRESFYEKIHISDVKVNIPEYWKK